MVHNHGPDQNCTELEYDGKLTGICMLTNEIAVGKMHIALRALNAELAALSALGIEVHIQNFKHYVLGVDSNADIIQIRAKLVKEVPGIVLNTE